MYLYVVFNQSPAIYMTKGVSAILLMILNNNNNDDDNNNNDNNNNDNSNNNNNNNNNKTTIIIVERRRSQKWRFQGCFSWLREWTTSQTHSTIARAFLNYTSRCYQQNTSPESEVLFRLWGNFPGSIPHVLAGCPALAQNKYLSRHNAALEILFLKLDEISWWCATLVFTSEAEACMRTAKHKYFGTFQCMQTITKWELIESMLK